MKVVAAQQKRHVEATSVKGHEGIALGEPGGDLNQEGRFNRWLVQEKFPRFDKVGPNRRNANEKDERSSASADSGRLDIEKGNRLPRPTRFGTGTGRCDQAPNTALLSR